MKLTTSLLLLATATTVAAGGGPDNLWQFAFAMGKGYDIGNTESIWYDKGLKPVMELAYNRFGRNLPYDEKNPLAKDRTEELFEHVGKVWKGLGEKQPITIEGVDSWPMTDQQVRAFIWWSCVDM